jgi:hypothetical protein
MALFSISTFIYLEVIYIPTVGLIWNLYFFELHERTLGSTGRNGEKGRNCRQAGDAGSSLPFPPLLRVEPRVHINNFQFGKLWISNGNN